MPDSSSRSDTRYDDPHTSLHATQYNVHWGNQPVSLTHHAASVVDQTVKRIVALHEGAGEGLHCSNGRHIQDVQDRGTLWILLR